MPHDGDNMLARIARIRNIGGPAFWSGSGRMSGVVGQKFGRMWSADATSSSQYSRISAAELRHVKYVYDWVKPIRPSPCIIGGAVNASARNSTSGGTAFT